MTSRNKGNKTCDDLIGVWWGGGKKNLSIGQEKKIHRATNPRKLGSESKRMLRRRMVASEGRKQVAILVSNQRSSQSFPHPALRLPRSMTQAHALVIRIIAYRLGMNIWGIAMVLGMAGIVSTDKTFTLDRR